jgi:hypothetical protein
MRKEEPKYGGKERLVLSRRNVLTLLAKLDGYPPGSAKTIMGGEEADGVEIAIEEDSEHYATRPAGLMYEDYERITKTILGM